MPLQLPSDIERDASAIVEGLDREAVDVYRFLAQRYYDSDPKSDALFQFVFRSFYRLDNAGLSREFKTRYFELMSVAKTTGHVDVSEVVFELRPLRNLRGLESLQFSFATKLLATVHPELPIYDAEVASVFGFKTPHSYKPFEQRLLEYLAFYVDLIDLYDDVVRTDQLRQARNLFRTRFGCSREEISDHKIMDFLFWTAGKQYRKAAQ